MAGAFYVLWFYARFVLDIVGTTPAFGDWIYDYGIKLIFTIAFALACLNFVHGVRKVKEFFDAIEDPRHKEMIIIVKWSALAHYSLSMLAIGFAAFWIVGNQHLGN